MFNFDVANIINMNTMFTVRRISLIITNYGKTNFFLIKYNEKYNSKLSHGIKVNKDCTD